MTEKSSQKNNRNQIYSVLLIVMIALASVAAASLAWFSIADTTQLSNMKIDITTGKSLRFDLEAHDSFEAYKQTLDFKAILDKMKNDKGIDFSQKGMEPITTSDGKNFVFQDGTASPLEECNYYEFVLHFNATTNMLVHLTSEDSEKGNDGTLVSSSNQSTPYSVRIAFLPEGETCRVYDPGMDGVMNMKDNLTMFGLFAKDKMEYNESNYLFYVPEGKDVPVTVRIWIEGTDEQCTNDIKESDFAVRLRFEGTDEKGQLLNN